MDNDEAANNNTGSDSDTESIASSFDDFISADAAGESIASSGIDPANMESPIINGEALSDVAKIWGEDDRPDRMLDTVISRTNTANKDAVARGIQSLYQSSLIDCVLYAMFGHNKSFDYIFNITRPRMNDRVNARRVLMSYIVNPLRKVGFVGAKRVVAFKSQMQSDSGLDPSFLVSPPSVAEFVENLMISVSSSPQFYLSRLNECQKRTEIGSSVLKVGVRSENCADGGFLSPFTTSQLLIEYNLLKNDENITNPRNLIIQLDRSPKETVIVAPLLDIYLVDVIVGSHRFCTLCKQSSESLNKPATLVCAGCFMRDNDHLQLCKCFYCNDCNPKFHQGERSNHISRQVHTNLDVSEGLTGGKWSLYGAKMYPEKAQVSAEDGAEQIIRSSCTNSNVEDDNSDDVTYPYELFAIVCRKPESHPVSHVAYVRTGVVLTNEIRKLIEVQEDTIERSRDESADASTKPKTATTATPSASSRTTDFSSELTSSTSIGESSRQVQAQSSVIGKSEVWLHFDPEKKTDENVHGLYNLPQVHAVEDFESLIDAKPVDFKDYRKRHRDVLFQESVALFYRPKMKDVLRDSTASAPVQVATVAETERVAAPATSADGANSDVVK